MNAKLNRDLPFLAETATLAKREVQAATYQKAHGLLKIRDVARGVETDTLLLSDLKQFVLDSGGIVAAAKEIGIVHGHLSDILSGNCSPAFKATFLIRAAFERRRRQHDFAAAAE